MRGNDNKLVKFTAFVLLITLLALVLVSGTFAKYTSSADGEDSARVAKWSILVGEKDITKATDKVTFNLFDTIKDSDGATEDDVKSNDKVIAPGTSGSFALDIKNESEVTAEYKVVYGIENTSNIPLEFTTTPDVEASWTKDITSLNKTDFTELAIGATAEATDTTIYWRWAFSTDEAGDVKDTTLGIDGTATVKVTAELTAQQKD